MLADTEGFVYVNANNDSIELNDYVYPFTKQMDITLPDERMEKRPRMQQHGEWPSFQWHSGMDITIEGDIFGQDSETFFAARTALINVLRYESPTPVQIQGTVYIDFLGSTERWLADITEITFSAPVGASSPSRCPFTLMLHSPKPYFYGELNQSLRYYYS